MLDFLGSLLHGCPCGSLCYPKRECNCTHLQIHRYHSKISGPFMDRVDIHMEVPPVHFKHLHACETGESSLEILERIKKARAIQEEGFQRMKLHANAHTNSRQIRK